MVRTALGMGLKLARVVPDVIVSVTGALNAGLPDPSRTVSVTVAELAMVMESGLTVRFMLAGTGGEGVPMVSDALLLKAPMDAEMLVSVFAAAESKVTEATPQGGVAPGQGPLVTAVAAGENVPAPTVLDENDTFAPAMPALVPSRTVAVTDVLLTGFAIVAAPSATAIVAGTCGGVPMVRDAVLLIVPDVLTTDAVIVTTAFTAAPAVNVTEAVPAALVVPLFAEKVPAVGTLTRKFTVAPDTAAAVESMTVAVTVAVPALAIAEGRTDT